MGGTIGISAPQFTETTLTGPPSFTSSERPGPRVSERGGSSSSRASGLSQTFRVPSQCSEESFQRDPLKRSDLTQQFCPTTFTTFTTFTNEPDVKDKGHSQNSLQDSLGTVAASEKAVRQQRIHRIISRHMRSHRFRQTGGSRSLASQRLIEQLKSPSKHPCDSQQLHAATMTDATHPTTEPPKFFSPIPLPTHVSPIFTFPTRLLPLSLTSLYSSRYVSKFLGFGLEVHSACLLGSHLVGAPAERGAGRTAYLFTGS